MTKAKVFALGTALLAAVALFAGPRLFRPLPAPRASNSVQAKDAMLDYSSQVLRNANPSLTPKKLADKAVPVAGITSHHLPVAEDFINEFYAQLARARPEISSFVVVGPDHFERCKTLATTTQKDFLTPFGKIENKKDLSQALLDAGAGEDNGCFAPEHSVAVEATFIKKYFPKAKVTPLLFSSAAPKNLAGKLAQIIFQADPNAVVICSTDFSHYQTAEAANLVDARTAEEIKNMDVSQVRLKQVDSPASLNFAVSFAGLSQAKPEYLTHANSAEFTGNFDNTTGYFDVIFSK